MLYIIHHPAALAHLGSLPQTPALAAYHVTTRTLSLQLTKAWDLPSLLIKPVQQFQKYARLLHIINEETPDSHGDKENLRHAKAMVEDVLRAIIEGQRRREIVKEVLAAGKPAEVLKMKGLGILGRVRGGMVVDVSAPRSISRADSEEAVQVAQMERDISHTNTFIQQFAKETVEWVKLVQAFMSALRIWAENFGRVIDLDPDATSQDFDAFLVVVDKQLSSICAELEAGVCEQLLPQLSMLLETIKRPTLLLDTFHALEPHHFASLQNISAKGRSLPALNEASVAYIVLRAQLCAEPPAYVKLLNTGVVLCVGQLTRWQARLWRDVRARWSDLWDALRVGGDMNAGSEETERVWRTRWDEASRDLRALSIISPTEGTLRPRQVRATITAGPPSPTTVRGAVNAVMSSLEPARTTPADTPSFLVSMPPVRRKRGLNTIPSWHRLAYYRSTASFASSETSIASDKTERLGHQPSTASFASSGTSITSYKTERTINSRKSRYNTLPRLEYSNFGRSRPLQGLVSLGADVPKVCRLISRRDMYNYPGATFQTELRDESFSSSLGVFPDKVQESRPGPQLDSVPTSSLPPLPRPPEIAEGSDEDTASDDNETDFEDAFAVGFFS